jgi:hypothetical protein
MAYLRQSGSGRDNRMPRIPVRTAAVANNTARAARPIGQHSEGKSFSMAPHDTLSLGIDIWAVFFA